MISGIAGVFTNPMLRRLVVNLAVLPALVGYSGAALAQTQVSNNPSSAAKIELVEFADFECPFCARQAADLRRLQAEYGDRLVVTFRNFPLSFHVHSRAAHRAALAAREQGKFWEMHDLIFSHPGHLASEDFEHYASELGLDMDRFHRTMTAGSSPELDADIAAGLKLGIRGTPAFVVHGHILEGLQSYGTFRKIIDAELSGQTWDHQPAASAEPVEVKTAGAPSLGASSASITIVEFSDFQCPFCARAVPGVKRLLEANPGNVRWIFKNFPLDFHADSEQAHLAALAAGKQGKFWEMHDLIFAHQQSIKRPDLLEFATQLKLDMTRFQQDLDDPRLRASVEADKSEGASLGVTGTPTYIINGRRITGFSEVKIQEMMAHSSVQPVAESQSLSAALPKLELSFGPEDAQWKIDWYADLGSPLTARSAVALQQFMAAHPGAVQVHFRNFPLPGREASMLLHEFVLAAAAQGKFWTVEALLLADPRPKDRNELKQLASQAGLDEAKLWKEVDAQTYASFISRDLNEAREAGVAGTPTFVVGDKKLDGVAGLRMLSGN